MQIGEAASEIYICDGRPNGWVMMKVAQIKPYPTQPNFKPYPTQANFNPYPTQAPSSYPGIAGGGVFTQPGQPPVPVAPVFTNFCDAVASLYAESIEEYITKSPDCVHEKGFNGQSPLHRACLRGDLDIVRLLLRHGANANGKNDFHETPLHFACKRGSPMLLRELIDNGADIRDEDRAGKGALHHAAQTGSVLAIHYLLEVCGLSPHVRDRNLSTPLHIVCMHGHVEAFDYFLKKERSDVTSRDAQGNTVLHIAASNGSSWMCWKLLEHAGCNQLHDINNDGCTPLELAKRGTAAKYVDVIRLLSYYTKNLHRRNGIGNTFDGVQLAWYGLLAFPFAAYPTIILLAHCLSVNKGLVVLVGVILLVAFRVFHSHRMNHISRMPSPAHAGMFASGLMYTILIYYVVILPDAFNDLGWMFVLTSAMLTLVVIYMYYKLMTCDPGVCKQPRQKVGLGQLYTIIDVANGHVRPDEFCLKCEIVRPETAIHCRLCDRCYHRVDHHCLFLYRCIAANNHRLFVLFNLVCMTVIALFLYAAFVYIETFFSREYLLDMAVLGAIFSSFPAVWSICVLNAMSFAWGIWLVHDQLATIANGGRSTRSYFWQRGTMQNPLTTRQRVLNITRFLLRGQQPVRYNVYPA